MFVTSIGSLLGQLTLEVGKVALHGVIFNGSGILLRRAADHYWPEKKEEEKAKEEEPETALDTEEDLLL